MLDSTSPIDSYFKKNSSKIKINGMPGLRRGQIAAIHSLVGHLSLENEPAIAVLPTGSGKTDVAILLPFLLASRRVLFVVPSNSVRSQITARFQSLLLLKKIGVIPENMETPKVKIQASMLTTSKAWSDLEEYDVVVTTPNSISPALKKVAPPPQDLFDLVVIDEAHHSAARTWQAILAAFPNAKRALFTATPFRRDRKQIKGKVVVNYPLRQAKADGVFGDITYVPVQVSPDETADEALAKAVDKAFKEDAEAGLKHTVLVRGQTIKRASELATVYSAKTSLRLRVINSSHTSKYIAKTIESLTKRELDGVICVDMLGEGFDYPNLKIAALHSPHSSLGVTLQFVGRFARVGDGTIGGARFFAIPGEIEGEMASLFSDESVWEDLILNLSEARLAEDAFERFDLGRFEAPTVTEVGEEELSLHGLRPGLHVKVYQVPVDSAVDLGATLDLGSQFEVVHTQLSEDGDTVVVVTKDQQRPKWSTQLRFGRIEYDLFIAYHDQASNLLFIAASRRSDALYRYLANAFLGVPPKGVPLYKLNRTLSGLSSVECFSVGMKNRMHVARQESYRMLAGRNAHEAIRKSDSRLYHQGHIYCKARNERNEQILLGYSSGSKIWSGGKKTISGLVQWCKLLAAKMESTTGVINAPGLDLLEVGVPLLAIPQNVFAVDWDPTVYEDGIRVVQADDSDLLLSDLSLSIERSQTGDSIHRISIFSDEFRCCYDFSPSGRTFFTRTEGESLDLEHNGENITLDDYLNEYPLYFYCTDFAKFRGDELFPCNIALSPYDVNLLECVDWANESVDIKIEFRKPDSGPVDMSAAAGSSSEKLKSVHEYLEARLQASDSQVVVYDHRSGEIADFMEVGVFGDHVKVILYHCKGSSAKSAGARVGELYEVCGQVVKSFNAVCDEARILRHVRRRINKGKVRSRFVKGSLKDLEKALGDAPGKRIDYEFVIVQPGVSKASLNEDMLAILAAANEFIHSLGAKEMRVMASA